MKRMFSKRLSAIILCVSLVLGMLPMYAVSVSAANDVNAEIVNPNFDMDLVGGTIPGWSLVPTTVGLLEISPDRAHTGSNSLHIKDSSIDTSLQVISDSIPVTAGYLYTAKAFVNVVSQSHSIGYEVHYYKSNGAEITPAAFINFNAATLGTNKWTEISVPFTVPVGATSVKLRINSGKPSLTEAYFDDVSIQSTTNPSQDPILPLNPGFEMDLVGGSFPGWSKDPTTAGLIELSAAVANSGSKSLHLHDTDTLAASPGLRALSDKVAVIPGKKYTVTASVYVVQQTAGIVHEVQYFDGNHVEITPRLQVLNDALTLNAWNEIKNVSDAPTTAAYARIGFYSDKESLTDAYFDNVTMEIDTTSTPTPTPTPVENLGFEMDLADGKIPGWSLVPTTEGLLELSTDKFHSGSRSLHFKDNSSKKLQVMSDVIPVIASTSYIAKAFVNVVTQSHKIGYEVHYYNDQGVKVGAATAINFSATDLGTNKWTEIKVPFTVPVGITNVKLYFISGDVSLTEAYFDDASISLDTPVTPPDDVANDILNPGFEKPLEAGNIPDWKLDPATAGLLELSTARANTGTNSLHLQDSDTTKGLRIYSNKFAIVPGRSYIAKASINVVQQSHNIVYETYYYNDQDVQVGVKLELFGALALGKNTWTEVRVVSDAPADAVYAKVAFFSGGISLTEAYFDDVSIELVPVEVPLDRQYAAPVDLGPMVSVNLGQAGVIQQNALGENEVYFHSNGLPGTFVVLDAETGARKFSEVIPNTESLWAMTIGPDKNVYFAGTNDGKLYRYLPEQKKVELLGTNPSDSWVWDLEATADGKIYGGTYNSKQEYGKVFEYDIVTNTFRDYGVIMQGQDYVRGIGVDDEYIYAGLGSVKHLFKINRVTGEKTEINVPGYTGTPEIMTDVFVVQNKLFVSVSTVNMVVMNKDTYEIEGNFQYNAMISKPYPANPNLVFYKYGTQFYQYDISTKQSTEIDIPFPMPDTGRVKDMEWIKMNSGVKAGKTVLSMVTQYGEYILYDPADNWLSFIELEISSQPVRIQSLETGPMDGRLYLGGYQRGMSIYNPFTNHIDLNISSFAQPEGIGFLNEHVYYGTYVGAIMYRFDPKQAASLNVNPKLVYDINHQDRPFAITSGDNKLFVGTVPDYGLLGGSLAIYDEAANAWKQFDQVVQDQSIISLAYKNGLLYGGTSVWGGLGSVPSATEAKIFVWDVAKGQKVEEFTLEIPGIDVNPKMIGELSFGPDGYLWGAVDGTIFAMDVTTKQIVKSKVIRPSLYNTSKWKPYILKWGPDGMLYTTLSRKLIAIDPETLSYKILADTFINDMTIGIDGSIYYAPEAGIALSRIAVPETDATLSSISIKGVALEGFSPGVLEYTSRTAPEALVEAVAAQAGATVTTAVYAKDKYTIIRVTGTDGKSTLDYKINWKAGNPTDTVNPDPVIPTVPANPKDPDTQSVNEESLRKNEQGVVAVPIEKGKTSVLLPINAAEVVGEQSIVLTNEEVTVDLAPEVLKQLFNLASAGELKDAEIKFSFEKVSSAARKEMLDQAKTNLTADINEAGEVFEFNLSIVSKDGKSLKLTTFDKPIKLTLKVNQSSNQDLAGIYYIANDGTLEYVGGKLENGSITADIQHFSKYAVLEVNKSFTDVPTSHWAANVIKSMAAKLIAQGVSDTEFAPEKSVTRAEFASLIVRALGLESKGTSQFTDVEAGTWYTSAVAAAYEAGIVTGMSETLFAPNYTITREQMAVMLLRAYEFQQGSKSEASQAATFADQASISSWASASVNTAFKLSLVSGRGNDRFIPQGELTRAEAIQAIANMMNK